VADSGKDSDTGYIPETLDYDHQRYFEAEDDHVIYQFTMKCTTKLGRSYINDYLFLVKLRDGKVCRMQEYWDSKQAFDLLYG
jgi:ketosteroid isomerase-like protein